MYSFVVEFNMCDIRVFFMQIEISDAFFFVFEVFKVIFLLRSSGIFCYGLPLGIKCCSQLHYFYVMCWGQLVLTRYRQHHYGGLIYSY